jgi:uncharacterized protein with von Willebrand factor type A (vWA) domain
MSGDHFLKMLDLNAEELDVSPACVTITHATPTTNVPLSPTVLQLDAWALRRGEELLAESERLKALPLDANAVSDFHASAFEPEPKMNEACVDQLRHEFIRQLLETPEYCSLHTSTMLDPLASEIAATAFAEQFSQMQSDDRTPNNPTDREIETLKAVGRALGSASTAINELSEAKMALGGHALGVGSLGSNDPKRIAELYRRVRSDPALQKIVNLAGRYRRLAQSRQRRKLVHGTDDVTGVVLDGDIGRLLPHELAKLAMPELEEDVLRRLVERQVMCREMKGSEPVAKGPIIVCCDESGSMEGDRNHASKALALAMAWVARKQKRWCALVAYSGDSGERLLPLPPGKWDEIALLEWLAAFIGCGSTIDVPVRELPEYYAQLKAPKGKTDVLFITDAKVHLPGDVRDRFISWKATAKARLITLVIGSEPGDLAAISDEVHIVQSLGVEEEAVGKAVSI